MLIFPKINMHLCVENLFTTDHKLSGGARCWFCHLWRFSASCPVNTVFAWHTRELYSLLLALVNSAEPCVRLVACRVARACDSTLWHTAARHSAWMPYVIQHNMKYFMAVLSVISDKTCGLALVCLNDLLPLEMLADTQDIFLFVLRVHCCSNCMCQNRFFIRECSNWQLGIKWLLTGGLGVHMEAIQVRFIWMEAEMMLIRLSLCSICPAFTGFDVDFAAPLHLHCSVS